MASEEMDIPPANSSEEAREEASPPAECNSSDTETTAANALQRPNSPPPEWMIRREPISPEILAYAMADFDLEEFMEGIREIRETGGFEMGEYLRQIGLEVTPDE